MINDIVRCIFVYISNVFYDEEYMLFVYDICGGMCAERFDSLRLYDDIFYSCI